jgi:hypothetical protein
LMAAAQAEVFRCLVLTLRSRDSGRHVATSRINIVSLQEKLCPDERNLVWAVRMALTILPMTVIFAHHNTLIHKIHLKHHNVR